MSRNGLSAERELLQYIGVHLGDIPPSRLVRALSVLRTGAGGLEAPVVSAFRVPFNKVPEAVIYPDGRMYFIGISDNPAFEPSLCTIDTTGQVKIIRKSKRITHLQGGNGLVGVPAHIVDEGLVVSYWTNAEGERRHATMMTEGCQLGSFMFFDQGRRFAYTLTLFDESTLTIIGSADRRIAPEQLINVKGVQVFNDELFYVSTDTSNLQTVHWGNRSRPHGIARVDVRTVQFDENKNALRYFVRGDGDHFICDLSSDNQGISKAIDRCTVSNCVEAVGGRFYSFQRGGDAFGLSQTKLCDLESLDTTQVKGEVQQLVRSGDRLYVYSMADRRELAFWALDGSGVPVHSVQQRDSDNLRLVEAEPIGDIERMIAIPYSSAILVVAKDDKSKDQYVCVVDGTSTGTWRPLIGSIEHITRVGDRLLSWHFDSGTLFILDYTPRP